MLEHVALLEGWKRVRLGEVSKIVKGITYKSSDYSESEEGAIFINLKCILKKGGFNKDGLKYYKGPIKESQMLNKDDIIIAIVDLTRDGDIIGYPLRVPDFGSNKIITMSMDVVKIEPDAQIDKTFLYYRLCLDDIHNYILTISAGSTVLHLDLNWLPQLELSIPTTLPEQRKIAEILETIDNVIEKTDKIIEKYKRIKQSLMQELLTKGIDENGQIRNEKTHKFKDSPLGRIPEEWEVVRLGEIFKLKSGTPKPTDTSKFGKYPVYGGNGILGYSNYKNFDRDTIIIGRVGEYCGSVYVATEGWVTDNALYVAEKKVTFLDLFLLHLLEYINLNKYSAETGQPLMTQSIIYDIKIPFPLLSEQIRISSILSQIDEVIKKEQVYKQKLERIKHGLMEDLLTGKVRVNCLIKEKKEVT